MNDVSSARTSNHTASDQPPQLPGFYLHKVVPSKLSVPFGTIIESSFIAGSDSDRATTDCGRTRNRVYLPSARERQR
jgi:hypothetical protein